MYEELKSIGSSSDLKTLLLIHTIHTYLTKFPTFIPTKAFDYTQYEGITVETVADVFCGCRTVQSIFKY